MMPTKERQPPYHKIGSRRAQHNLRPPAVLAVIIRERFLVSNIVQIRSETVARSIFTSRSIIQIWGKSHTSDGHVVGKTSQHSCQNDYSAKMKFQKSPFKDHPLLNETIR